MRIPTDIKRAELEVLKSLVKYFAAGCIRTAYFLFIGACFSGGVLFALATYDSPEPRIMAGWAISALFFALGFMIHESPPPRFDVLED